jgi:hypothetical protein
MGKSIREQILSRGLIPSEETPKPAARKARLPVEEKALPPPFEAAPRGVIVGSQGTEAAARACVDCGAELPPAHQAGEPKRCAECAAAGDAG